MAHINIFIYIRYTINVTFKSISYDTQRTRNAVDAWKDGVLYVKIGPATIQSKNITLVQNIAARLTETKSWLIMKKGVAKIYVQVIIRSYWDKMYLNAQF